MKKRKKIFWFLIVILIAGLLIPEHFSMPVEGAKKADYNQKSFWYYPWGRSGTHKGVDIFAKKGTNLNASVSGIVLYSGTIQMGGNVVLILGPKWRLHYYAHMDTVTASFGWVTRESKLGTIGDSGNAKGKPPHLHYSIATPLPHFWKITKEPQGWKKMFYLNPTPYLNEASS